MKKYIIIFLTLILVVSSFQAIGITKDNAHQEIKTLEESLSFSSYSIYKNNDFKKIEGKGTNEHIQIPGHPQIPITTKLYKLPGRVSNININCHLSEYHIEKISGKIQPEPQTVYPSKIDMKDFEPTYITDSSIYTSDIFYPDQPYDYSIRCGLDSNGIETTFVYVKVHPIQYNPVRNTIKAYSDAHIKIDYQEHTTEKSTFNKDTVDLIIIAPETFVDPLQDFVAHKNNMGLTTIIKTTESIFNEYPGRDEPEQIKYFIKEAKEEMDTSYVLLFGGLKSYLYAKDKDHTNYGVNAWHVPVRYAHITEGDEESAISDLYFSDLYRYNEETEEWEFEDWDVNGDDIFAKWSFFASGKDDLDLVPDIYVGRLPCRNTFELNIITKKIINYESSSPDEKDWFDRFIGVSGKNFALWEGQPDGEFLVDRAIENMSDYIGEIVRIYASNDLSGQGPIPISDDIITEISKGAGFVDFEGHGNPVVWDTIKADGEYEDHDWVGGIRIPDFLEFSNGDKLPVVMVGGCHNGLYNVSVLRILFNRDQDPPYYWTTIPTPLCFCYAMVVKPGGGAIASIGATGLGPASGGDPVTLQGEIDNYFFYVIGQDHVETLGAAHSGAVTKYVTENDMNRREAFTATITQLFGDPSLRLGGYP